MIMAKTSYHKDMERRQCSCTMSFSNHTIYACDLVDMDDGFPIQFLLSRVTCLDLHTFPLYLAFLFASLIYFA